MLPRIPFQPICSSVFFLLLAALAAASEPIDLGARRELFVDDYLVARRDGLELRLHPPARRETVLTYNAPWEGSGSDFQRVIRDGDLIRMYYMAGQLTTDNGLKLASGEVKACVLESVDGIHWVRPDLGLVAFHGSKHNNIIYTAPKLDNFTPFRDSNPDCPPDERYKATTLSAARGLYGFKSPDGLHWSPISDQPIITHGTFDTQNNAFWDPVRKHYWCYIRGFHDQGGRSVTSTGHGTTGIRDIRVTTSADFRHWTDPVQITFTDSPEEALYTNQIEPYYRAPQLFVGFPTRYVDRKFSPAALQTLPDPAHRQRRMSFVPRYGTVVTDGQFMTSRDGRAFHRWDEVFIPAGPERSNNWIYGDGYQSLGLLQTPTNDPTAPPELSCYAGEGHWKEGSTLRRYTLRIDGFVSLHAPLRAGEFMSKPLKFSGNSLTLNFSTSAAGSIRVELRSPDGAVLPGFSLADCDELFGDTLDRTVTWQGRSDLGALAGKPICLHMTLRQADLYSLKFEP
jgi:hypothetical protein